MSTDTQCSCTCLYFFASHLVRKETGLKPVSRSPGIQTAIHHPFLPTRSLQANIWKLEIKWAHLKKRLELQREEQRGLEDIVSVVNLGQLP